jgi:hypothetical protein
MRGNVSADTPQYGRRRSGESRWDKTSNGRRKGASLLPALGNMLLGSTNGLRATCLPMPPASTPRLSDLSEPIRERRNKAAKKRGSSVRCRRTWLRPRNRRPIRRGEGWASSARPGRLGQRSSCACGQKRRQDPKVAYGASMSLVWVLAAAIALIRWTDVPVRPRGQTVGVKDRRLCRRTARGLAP